MKKKEGMEMEYLDIYDENGKFLGSEERSKVHKEALWHNTVHCWLYDKEGNVYFQIRKDKNKLYTTASGHVKSGETIKEAFGREIEEEIGYHVDYNKAELIEINKYILDREEENGFMFRDRAFANVYGCLFTGTLEEFDYQTEELEGIVRLNAKNTLEVLKEEKGSLAGTKCYKEQEEIKVTNTSISFEEFLVNKGETAIEKYGKVLEFIINKIDRK